MRHRIFIISYIYDIYIRGDMGGHRKVLELARALKSLDNEVTVFIPSYEHIPLGTDVRIVGIKTFPIYIVRQLIFNISFIICFVRECFMGRPSLVYCRPFLSFLPLLLSRLFGAKIFFEVNGNPFQGFKQNQYLKKSLIRYINKINYMFSDRVIAISPGIKELLMREFSLQHEKIAVITSATDPDHFAPADINVCRKEIGLEQNLFVAGFVGSFFEYQGIGLLIKAAPMVIEKVQNAHFLLVGDGEMRKIWEADVNAANLAEYFTFTGQVPYKKVNRYVGAMDICLAPLLSNRDEASPLKVYDCLSCGKPVVLSNIEPLRDLIKEVRGIVVFEPDDTAALSDAIVSLAKNRSKIAELGKNARDYIVKGHSWKDNALSVIDLLGNN